ncbi:MAG TPA: hypothetical protein VF894_07905 [Anaeromyxobacter sp.]
MSGTCADTTCKQFDEGCTAAGDCCSRICTSGKCASLVGGNGCKTLADACTVSSDCCSKDCKGATDTIPGSGTCVPSFSCHAYYDICFRDAECCSGVCDTSLSNPGRCKQMPGSCTQDGNPCANDSNCCTRLCQDLGAGAKVCQPAAGCRMTGDYCDRQSACCGGSADAMRPDGYQITCDTAGDHRCDNGTACNPPGNTCGDSSSWNCCDGKKAVCKPDSNGISRCFGGGSVNCPTGYDANNPACCIATADPANLTTVNVCQFSGQCCGGAPCVPDVNGVLHCNANISTCTPKDQACSGADDLSCCAPNTCNSDGAGGFKCGLDTGGCGVTGATCATDASCCSNLCRDAGTGLKCVACVPNALSCAANGQCCSGSCDPATNTCAKACVGDGSACTGDIDCCGGVCNIPLGTTSGTCAVLTCGQVGSACNDAMPCCSGTCFGTDPILGQVPCAGIVSGCSCGE